MAGPNDIVVKILAAADYSSMVAEAKKAYAQIAGMAATAPGGSSDPSIEEAIRQVRSAVVVRSSGTKTQAGFAEGPLAAVKALDEYEQRIRKLQTADKELAAQVRARGKEAAKQATGTDPDRANIRARKDKPASNLLEADQQLSKRAQKTIEGLNKKAALQEELAGSSGFRQAKERVAVALQKQAADLQSDLAKNDKYRKSTEKLAVSRQQIAADTATDLAKNKDYRKTTEQLAVARQRMAADSATDLAKNKPYITASVELAAGRQKLAAAVQGELARGTSTVGAQYRKSQVDLAVANQRLAADKQGQLAGDTATGRAYRAATERLVVGRKREEADIAQRLADNTPYRVAQSKLAVAQSQQAANLQESLATNKLYAGKYADSQARVALAGQQQAANIQSRLAGGEQGDAYASATAQLAVARQQQAAKAQELISGEGRMAGAYADATARVASARQQQAASVQQRLYGDDAYQEATKQLAVVRQQQAAKTQTALADDPLYKQASKDLAVARQRQAADLQSSLAGDKDYKAATAKVATARAQIQTSVAQDEEYRAATVALTVARRANQAAVQQALAKDPEYAQATADAAIAKEQQSAALRATLAADQQYIEATARNANAKEEQAARITLARAGVEPVVPQSPASALLGANNQPLRGAEGPTRDQQKQLVGQAEAVKRAEADRAATAVAKQGMTAQTGVIQAAVERRVAEGQLNVAIRKEERELMRSQIKSGAAGGSFMQRAQALMSQSGKAPEEFQTGGQLLGSKAITSAGYMAGGMLSGALMFGTINAVKDASKLQEQLVGLRAQMAALGNEQAFVGVANGIKEISNQTGLAASEVAKFYSRLLGVFSNPTDALKQADSAMKLAVVSGTDLNTMMEELVPVARAFNVSMTEIGDTAVYIKDHFGVAEEATLHFLGEVAPMAEEAGLSLQEMGVIGGTAANAIGKSISAAGEQIAKVFPTMQANQDKIYAIFRESPQTAKFVDPMIEAFGSGQTGEALKIMLQGWDQLNSVQQESLVHVSGSRREWAILNGIFAQSGKLLRDMSDAEAGKGGASGGLERRFDQVSKTLNRTIEQIQQTFKNLVEGALSSGIGDVFVGIAKGAETVIGALNKVMSIFNELNETFKIPGIDFPFLAPLLQMGVALTLGTKLMGIFSGALKVASGSNIVFSKTEEGTAFAISTRNAAMAAGEPTLATDTGLKEADAAATTELAAAETAGGAAAVSAAALRAGGGVEGLALAARSSEAAGSFIGRSRLLTRGFSGGSLIRTPGLDALSASQGMAVGATALPVIGMAAIGAMQVKSSYDENKGKVEQASNDLRERMKGFGDARLKQIIDTQNDFWDNFHEKVFNEDMPATLAAKEQSRRKGEQGGKVAKALVDTGTIDKFTNAMTDDQLAQINSIMSQTYESVDAVEEAGSDVHRGVISGALNWASKNLNFIPGSAGLLKGGRGRATASRDDMKKLIPILEKKRDEQGDEQAAQSLVMINSMLENTATGNEVRQAVHDAIDAGDVNKAIEKAGGVDEFLKIQGYYDPEGMLKTGQISKTQYVDIMRQKVTDLRKQVGKSPDAEKFYKEFDQKLAELQGMSDQVVMEGVDFAKFISGMTSFTPKMDSYRQFQAAFPKLDWPGQLQQIQPMLQAGWEGFQEQLSQTSSIAEWVAKASQGQRVDPANVLAQYKKKSTENRTALKIVEEARTVGATALDRFNAVNPGFTGPISEKEADEWLKKHPIEEFNQRNPTFVGPVSAKEARDWLDKHPQVTEVAADINQKVIERATNEGISYKDALLAEMVERKKKYEDEHGVGSGTKYDRIIEEINAAGDDLSDVSAITSLRPDQRTIDKQANTWQAALDKSVIQLRAAQGGTSPYVQAQADIDIANREVQRIQREMEIAPNPELQTQLNEAKANVAKAYQAQANLVDQTAAAMENWDVVEAHGDQIRSTNARLRNAYNNVERIRKANKGDERDPALISARQAARELEFQQYDDETNRVKGMMEVAAFGRNRDPVVSARDALAQAEYAYSRIVAAGGGTIEQNAAMLQVLQARRQLEDAMESNLQADAQLAMTLLEARQDPVGAARKAVVEATRRLQRAEQLGLGQDTAEWKQLYGELQNKRVAAIDADVQNQEDIINYLLEMGQITTSEAAARLRVEANKYEVGTKKWRDIQMRIHQLENGGGADLQFNLPTQLGLPTLYEARRLNQGLGMGMGYQDNRNQTISIQVNGVGDPAATAQQVMQAFQAATGSANVYSGAVSGVG